MTTVEEEAASERTVPDTTLDEEAKAAAREQAKAALEQAKAAAASEQATPVGEDLRVVEIPVPNIAAANTRRGLDGVTLIALISFVLVGGLLVFGFAQALVPAAEAQLGAACRPLTPVPKSGALPAIELEDLAGNPASLEQFRGKFVVLNFWATWCDPCTREWPDLDLLATRMAERDDIVVVAVSVDERIDDIAPYLERMSLSETRVKILRAKDPKAYELLGSEKIPDTYFVSADGELEAVFVNVREWGRPKAIRCIEASAAR